jgi:hypothetical protein
VATHKKGHEAYPDKWLLIKRGVRHIQILCHEIYDLYESGAIEA